MTVRYWIENHFDVDFGSDYAFIGLFESFVNGIDPDTGVPPGNKQLPPEYGCEAEKRILAKIKDVLRANKVRSEAGEITQRTEAFSVQPRAAKKKDGGQAQNVRYSLAPDQNVVEEATGNLEAPLEEADEEGDETGELRKPLDGGSRSVMNLAPSDVDQQTINELDESAEQKAQDADTDADTKETAGDDEKKDVNGDTALEDAENNESPSTMVKRRTGKVKVPRAKDGNMPSSVESSAAYHTSTAITDQQPGLWGVVKRLFAFGTATSALNTPVSMLLTSAQMAEQLTIMEQRVFCSIHWTELLRQEWQNEAKKKKKQDQLDLQARNIRASIERFNQVCLEL